MTYQDVMTKLKALGSEQTRKTFARHGCPEDFFGVKVGDMKLLVKQIKKDYQLALDLYATGNGDAQYFAGLIADDMKMTKKDLQSWADNASWHMVSDYSVAWTAAGSPHGFEMGLKWIDSKKPATAACGWNTISSVMSLKADEDLDIKALEKLIDRVVKTIHDQPDRVRYNMNGFVIAAGAFVAPLYDKAMAAAKKIGTVEVDMGDTACKVPDAVQYLEKMKARGIGKKRKSAKC